jgi:transcriptional regulator with XRE-family HTH domain
MGLMMHAAQIRAARGLLNWRQEDLARHARIAAATILRIEKTNGPVMGYVSTQLKIQQAFERAGIRFIDADASGGIGVRLESAPQKGRGKRRAKGP